MLTVIPDTVFPALPVLPKIFHLISQCRSKEILPILPISLEIMQHPLGVLTRSLPHCTFVPDIGRTIPEQHSLRWRKKRA